MVVVLNARIAKRDQVAQLGELHDELHLLLAAQAAGAAAFDWNVLTGEIRWEGATDILPQHLDMTRADAFLEGIGTERRRALTDILNMRGPQSEGFLVDVEVAGAMGTVAYTLAGTRTPDADGRNASSVRHSVCTTSIFACSFHPPMLYVPPGTPRCSTARIAAQ